MEEFISNHSLRVGSAVSLAQAGASVVGMQVAGRWKLSSPKIALHENYALCLIYRELF